MHHRLQQRQQLLESRQLLFVDEDVGVFHLDPHLVGVGDEVRRDVAAVELHALDDFELGLQRLGLFDRDDALIADLLHRVGEKRPISASPLAEMVPTWAISSFDVTFFEFF